MAKFLIVGLGNPGTEYANTRHNIGFDVVGAFVAKHQSTFKEARLAYMAEVIWNKNTFICVCPTTFMNLSGRAFKYWIEKEKIALQNTLTVVDDLALPIQKIRLRAAGTHAGHNGLKDIQAILGTDAYPKLRFGIGDNFAKGHQADFVLSKWDKNEISIIQAKVQLCVEIIENFATIGLEKTMSTFNQIVTTN